MAGFETVAADIRAAARAMTTTANEVGALHPERAVDKIATALPGSQSAGAATALAAAWARRFGGWHDDAGAQAEKMHHSAEDYDASDYQADARLRILMHHTGMDR